MEQSGGKCERKENEEKEREKRERRKADGKARLTGEFSPFGVSLRKISERGGRVENILKKHLNHSARSRRHVLERVL